MILGPRISLLQGHIAGPDLATRIERARNGREAREVARLWALAQPAVSAYIASLVRDFRDRDDVLQDVAVAVLISFGSYESSRLVRRLGDRVARNQVFSTSGARAETDWSSARGPRAVERAFRRSGPRKSACWTTWTNAFRRSEAEQGKYANCGTAMT